MAETVQQTKSENQQAYIPPSIVMTDSAAKKVYELIKEENNFNLNLRVYIQGGGCSGFQYGFSFDEKINEGDTVIEKYIEDNDASISHTVTVKLLIDPMSFPYFAGGTEIDYKDDMDGERFIIRNPNAKTTCGCGSSFST